MRRRAERVAVLALAALACAAGCAPRIERREVRVGRHTLRLVVPAGWEHLDHGRQQLFRVPDAELLLEDYGPATREGLIRELREAQGLLRAGRRDDAIARVGTLHGLTNLLLPRGTRGEYWSPWTDVTYIRDRESDATLDRALDALIRGAEAMRPLSTDQLADQLVAESNRDGRHEIARREWREIHGARWVALETWDRVSHMNRHRLACMEVDGYLVVLTTRRGLIEMTGEAFDALLASIQRVTS